jgi:hypothetical protein
MAEAEKGTRWFEDTEIVSPVFLCNGSGNLNLRARGWSKFPLQTCNLTAHPLRKKRWNYWCITGKDVLFSITISDLDYAGVVFAYFLDYRTGETAEKTVTVPFSKNVYLGDTVSSLSSFQNDNVDVQFLSEAEGVSISLSWLRFRKGKDLSAELFVRTAKKHETLNVVVPWNDSSRFQFTSKQNCLPAQGFFSIGSKQYGFDPAESFACLDFGRGVWPYRSSWNWGSFSGYSGKNIVGANLGAKWTDGSGVTENALCVNGKLTKIKEKVLFEYDRHDFMKPWVLRTECSDSVDLVFTPFFERQARSGLLVVSSSTHQLFGRYSGTVKAGRKKIGIDNIIGWAEDHISRW